MVDDAPNGSQRRNRHGKVKYMSMLQDVADRIRTEVIIDLNDLEEYEKTMAGEQPLQLVASIEKNAHHYLETFSRAVDKLLPESTNDTR